MLFEIFFSCCCCCCCFVYKKKDINEYQPIIENNNNVIVHETDEEELQRLETEMIDIEYNGEELLSNEEMKILDNFFYHGKGESVNYFIKLNKISENESIVNYDNYVKKFDLNNDQLLFNIFCFNLFNGYGFCFGIFLDIKELKYDFIHKSILFNYFNRNGKIFIINKHQIFSSLLIPNLYWSTFEIDSYYKIFLNLINKNDLIESKKELYKLENISTCLKKKYKQDSESNYYFRYTLSFCYDDESNKVLSVEDYVDYLDEKLNKNKNILNNTTIKLIFGDKMLKKNRFIDIMFE